MELAKLDAYEYMLLPGYVRIEVDGSTDPDLVDIMSEIEKSNDIFYIEGRYYNFLGDYKIVHQTDKTYLELAVIEVMGDLIPDILNSRGVN